MQKRIIILSAALIMTNCTRKFGNESNDNSKHSVSDTASNKTNMSVLMASSALSLKSMKIDIKCTGALQGNNDWNDINVEVLAANPNFNIIKNVPCTITLKEYSDGTKTYTPKTSGTPLVITVNSDGNIAKPYSVVAYSDSDNNTWYFAAGNKQAYSLIINYGTDPGKVIADISNVTMQQVTVNAGTAPTPPDISNFRISKVTSNIPGKADYSLFGKAENFTACKIVSSSELIGFDYNSINLIFDAATVSCPDNILSGVQGNWNAFSDTEKYIIWQNTDDNAVFSSYTLLYIPQLL